MPTEPVVTHREFAGWRAWLPEGLYLLGGAAGWFFIGLEAGRAGETYLVWSGRLGLSAALVLVSVWDWKTESVPNWITLPLLAFATVRFGFLWHAGALTSEALWIAGLGWLMCLCAFWVEAFGEGDVKLAMALLALFPDVRFVWLLLVVLFAGSLLALSLLRGRAGWRRFSMLLGRAATIGRLASRDENRAAVHAPGGAHRSAWMFALAALVFLGLS